MNNFFYTIDKNIFFFINHTLANPVFDVIMPFITNLNHNKIVLIGTIIFLLWLLIKGGEGRKLVIVMILTIVATDQLNSFVLKSLFERIRPCYALEGVRTIVGCAGGFSFPSSHAANSFAIATAISFFYRKQTWGWFTFAFFVAFSRPYLGVHYPSDIFVGSLVGISSASMIVFCWKYGEEKITSRYFLKEKNAEE